MTGVARPLPGPGVVARHGDLLLVCADGGPGVDALLDVTAEVARSGGNGEFLVRRVAALLATDSETYFPACALCGPAADGRLAVLVYRDATAVVATPDGEVSLTGVDAITSVNRLVSGPCDSVTLCLPGAGEPDPRARLDGGVVTGAGVKLSTVDASSAPAGGTPGWAAATPPPSVVPVLTVPVTAPPPPGEPPARPVTMPPPQAPPAEDGWRAVGAATGVGAAEAPAPVLPELPVHMDPLPADLAPPAHMDPLPADVAPPAHMDPPPAVVAPPAHMDPPPADLAPPTDHGPEPGPPPVIGVFCPKGHFIDPRQPYCPVCGISMAQQTVVAREGPRPSLGVLTLDDGEAVPLDIDQVIGRDPRHDPDVVAGTAKPLKIVDAEGVVSRRHVRIALVGWDVQIIDLGSANGTFIQPPGAAERQQLVAETPVVIKAGTVVTLGRRWFRLEPPRVP